MLELKNVKKSYTTGNFTQHALKGIDLQFRKSEFVAILGPSGSGKTTLLNIIGGLDRYDSGDLIINGKSTTKFRETEWDAYRNNCIGFVFQSYNLISHISVLDNVEMGMTLSGVASKEKREKALAVLERVGLKEHAHKKPNQLSGGQMQRVAIARALANDPDIILADEPTGALDSATSVQIMNLIQEIAKDKLVIMVTHNPELAASYATRIVEMKDGELLKDSNPIQNSKEEKEYKIRKTSMSFFTALKLSFNNIITKKGRTFLTAFASSIGIIGIALILSLSNGFDIQIDQFEHDTLSSLPIMVSEQAMEMSESMMAQMKGESELEEYPSGNVIYAQPSMEETMLHTNKLTKEYMDYIEKINPTYVSGVSYMRMTAMNFLIKNKDSYRLLDSSKLQMGAIPKSLGEAENEVVNKHFDVIAGSLPSKKEELLLIVDSRNRVSEEILKLLGLDVSQESFTFEDLLDLEIRLVLNDDYYRKIGQYFTINTDFAYMYESEKTITLKISGIIRGKKDDMLGNFSNGIGYIEELIDYVVSENQTSEIVKMQQENDYNVLTGEKFELDTKEGIKQKDQLLSYLGADAVPVVVQIYPRDFDSKDEILSYLDAYNEGKEEDEQILYTDMASMITGLSGSIMSAITIVLIAFSAISLIVSSIMIGIITYISVLERTKEIGVLRAMGARKKDITRVFNAETFIIGICSGMLGILISRILIFPINIVIENLTDLPNVARMNPIHAIILVMISVILTVIGGAIPARVASRKDPVEALRTE